MDGTTNTGSGFRGPPADIASAATIRQTIFLLIGCAALLVPALLLALSASARSDEQAKRVLILVPYNSTYPGVVGVSEGAMRRLREKSPVRLELLPEFLDLARYPGYGDESLVARYLAEKYASKRPDVVITAGRLASHFVLKYRASLVRDVPLVLCCLPAALFEGSDKPLAATGVVSGRDITKTLDLAERLQPAARRLVVIAGATQFDRDWIQIARGQIESRARKFDTQYLIGLPVEKLTQDVSSLSPDTIVIALTYFSDASGNRYASPEVMRQVARAASAPVYSPYATNFGFGILGGHSAFDDSIGVQLADLALKILNGTDPAVIAPQMSAAHAFHVDDRQLRRWTLSTKNLPANATVHFQTPSLWDEHRYLILSVVAAFAAMLGITIFVIVQHVRRVAAERSLSDSENRMDFAAVSTNSGLWQLKAEDQPIWMTDYCRTLFDLPKDGVVTLQNLLTIVHPEDKRALARAMRATLRDGIPLDCEFRINRPDGHFQWIAAKGQVFRPRNEQSAIVNGLFTDVTSLKEAERDAELQRREVTHLTRQSVLNELSGSIAHELNQPLTAILSNAEAAQDLLDRKKVNLGKVREILNDIVKEDNRAAEVIRRVRRMLRKEDTRREAIAPDKLIESTLALLRNELISKKIAIEVECAPNLPMVFGDSIQLQQVLINLLVNAMDAMAITLPLSERKIVVRAMAEGDRLSIAVSDNGHGVPTEIRDTLFQSFVSTKEHGLGMGLSICATILKSHAGEIIIENNVERGATATVTLPAKPQLVPA